MANGQRSLHRDAAGLSPLSSPATRVLLLGFVVGRHRTTPPLVACIRDTLPAGPCLIERRPICCHATTGSRGCTLSPSPGWWTGYPSWAAPAGHASCLGTVPTVVGRRRHCHVDVTRRRLDVPSVIVIQLRIPRRTSCCNAAETPARHADIAADFLPLICRAVANTASTRPRRTDVVTSGRRTLCRLRTRTGTPVPVTDLAVKVSFRWTRPSRTSRHTPPWPHRRRSDRRPDIGPPVHRPRSIRPPSLSTRRRVSSPRRGVGHGRVRSHLDLRHCTPSSPWVLAELTLKWLVLGGRHSARQILSPHSS